MFFYVIFLIGIGLSFAYNQKRSSKWYAGLLGVLAIFRYGIGPDYFSYKYLFERLRPNVIHEITAGLDNQEIGFRVIGSIFRGFGLNYQIYITFFALVSLVFIYKIIEKYSENPTFSLTIFYSFYYFVWVFSSIRQGIAMSIGVYFLLEAINEKKVKLFIGVVLMLTLIHTSSVILLVFYFFSKFNWNRKKLMILTGISIIFSILPLGLIVARIAEVIPVFKRMLSYIVVSPSLTNIFDFQTMGRLFFVIIGFVIYDEFKKKYPEDSYMIDLYIFSFIVYFFFKFSELTAARMAVYGKLFEIIIFTNLMYMIHITKKQVIALGLALLIMSAYLFKELNAMEKTAGLIDDNPISTPYVNIFNEDDYTFDSKYDFMDR